MIDKIKHLFIGRKCSICNKKMWRSLDDGRMWPSISTSYHCGKCEVWILEKNFNWYESIHRIDYRYRLSMYASHPGEGWIEGSWNEGHLWTIPINRIYLSAEDIASIRKTIDHLLLLS